MAIDSKTIHPDDLRILNAYAEQGLDLVPKCGFGKKRKLILKDSEIKIDPERIDFEVDIMKKKLSPEAFKRYLASRGLS